jgi:hypothetical protein
VAERDRVIKNLRGQIQAQTSALSEIRAIGVLVLTAFLHFAIEGPPLSWHLSKQQRKEIGGAWAADLVN